MAIDVIVRSLDDLQHLAHLFTESLSTHGIRYVLCSGEYGVGKTTFIRNIVTHLPYIHDFEISSPSFTTYNIYPTIPPCLHIDLYATHRSLTDILEEVEEEIENPLVLIEWAERSYIIPNEPFLSCTLSYTTDMMRCISCRLHGLDSTMLHDIYKEYELYYLRSTK